MEDSREELSPSPDWRGGGVLGLEGCVVGAACEKGHLVEAQRSESWVVGRDCRPSQQPQLRLVAAKEGRLLHPGPLGTAIPSPSLSSLDQ